MHIQLHLLSNYCTPVPPTNYFVCSSSPVYKGPLAGNLSFSNHEECGIRKDREASRLKQPGLVPIHDRRAARMFGESQCDMGCSFCGRFLHLAGGAWAYQNPTLREMLAVEAKLPGEGGQNNQFRAQVIAFDRLLRYEWLTGHRFQHILVLRPDFAPYLGHEDPAVVVTSVNNSVFFYNDLITICARKFATSVFTLPATIRSFHTARDKDAWQSLTWKTSESLQDSLCLDGTSCSSCFSWSSHLWWISASNS